MCVHVCMCAYMCVHICVCAYMCAYECVSACVCVLQCLYFAAHGNLLKVKENSITKVTTYDKIKKLLKTNL